MIPDSVLEQIRDAADIIAIIGEHVPLKRAGNSYRGPCPFHQGKDRNFSVQPGGGYTCFVCGEKGDAIAFVQKRLGLDFADAVRLVAGKSGVAIPTHERSAPDPRAPLWELNAAAAEYFIKQLRDDRTTIEYLASRGLSLEDVRKFGIGYAPRGDTTRSYLQTLGFDDQRQTAGGLLKAPDDGQPARFLFRDRLMFPIGDAQGNAVGFGGRAMGDFKPKYLNSAESPVFSKGELLYGFYRAKTAARRSDRMLIVEGFFDTIRLVLAGVDEVVAPLGTALTPAQCILVRKYASAVYLLYDADAGGLKATFRSADLLLAAGVAPSVVTLPDGSDPDSFVREHGRPALEELIEKSVDVLDRKIELLTKAGRLDSTAGKRAAIDKLMPTIRAASDPLLQDLYLARAADALGVRRSTLERLNSPKAPRFGKAVNADIVEPPRPTTAAAPARPSPPWQTIPRKAAP